MLLFGLRAERIPGDPFVIGLMVIPLMILTYGIFAIACSAAHALRLPHNVAALTTVVGVLVEVPVMLALVTVAHRTTRGFGEATG